jgi:CBS domain-containing membrane protein
MVKTTEISVSELVKPAKTISGDMEIQKALHLMKTENIDFLSVVDDKQNLIGAVSEANLIKLVKQESPSLIGDPVWFDSVEQETGKKAVATIMTTGITTIAPHDNIATALRVMNATGYKLLHVVDVTGKLLGIIRMRDIAEKLLI